VISPRVGRRPSAHSRRRFAELGVRYSEVSLHSPTPEYGPSFRVLALAWQARQQGPAVLVQLDSDTVFLDEPDLGLGGHVLAARPVDTTGMCSRGPGHARETLWEKMCAVNNVDVDAMPYVHTTVGHERVRANYNGGLVVARRDLYVLIEECFEKIVADDLRPFRGAGTGMRTGAEMVSPKGVEMWGTSQAAISIALTKMKTSARILDPGHNIPLHLFGSLDLPADRIVHLHYHWLFDDPSEPNPALDGRLHLRPIQRDWLRERLASRTTLDAADVQ
jgi:hypothetical protein